MPVDIKGYRVFIASPSGLEQERKSFREALREYNEMDAWDRGVAFWPVGWEETLGGVGRPQSIINDEIRLCDYFVMILWDRWGSSPDRGGQGQYTSGTEEEYHVALQCRTDNKCPMRDVIVFFKAVDQRQMSDPGTQLQKVLDFRKSLEKGKALLFHTYDEVESFTKVLRRHLASWIRDHESGSPPTNKKGEMPLGLVPGGSEAPMSEGDVLRGAPESQDVGEAIKGAWRLADDGRLTDAETRFAQLTVGGTDPDALNAYGHFLRRLGRLGQAEVMHQQALDAGKALDRKDAIADAYANLGMIHRTRGELDKAEEMHQRALSLEETLGHKEGMATAYGNLGLIYRIRGQLKEAEDMHRKSLAINEALGCKEGMASDYGRLGVIYGMRQELGQAEEMLQKALTISEALGHKEGMASQYGNLGLIYQLRGQLGKAEDMLKKSLALNEALGHKGGMANGYANLGLIYERRGDTRTAAEYGERALALFKEVGMKPDARDAQQWLDELHAGRTRKGGAGKRVTKAKPGRRKR